MLTESQGKVLWSTKLFWSFTAKQGCSLLANNRRMGIYFKTEKENNQKEKKYNMAGYRISCTVQVSGPKLIWKDVIYTFFTKKKMLKSSL